MQRKEKKKQGSAAVTVQTQRHRDIIPRSWSRQEGQLGKPFTVNHEVTRATFTLQSRVTEISLYLPECDPYMMFLACFSKQLQPELSALAQISTSKN